MLAVYGWLFNGAGLACGVYVIWLLTVLTRAPYRLVKRDQYVAITAGVVFATGFALYFASSNGLLPQNIPLFAETVFALLLYGQVYLLLVFVSRLNHSVEGTFSPHVWAVLFTFVCGLTVYAHIQKDTDLEERVLLALLFAGVFGFGWLVSRPAISAPPGAATSGQQPPYHAYAVAEPTQSREERKVMSPPLPPEPAATQDDRRAERAAPALAPHAPPAASDIPRNSRSQHMQLKLRRSQRSSTFAGKVIFTLDARMEVPAQEAQLVSKYRLGELVIYDSANREKYGESMQAHLESTRDQPGFREGASSQLLGVGKTFYRLARAGASAAMASLKLRVTVASLMGGVHVECKSMDELLGAEKAIVEAAENLRAYLDTAETFDGRETVLEF
jgi:hypothetical protein